MEQTDAHSVREKINMHFEKLGVKQDILCSWWEIGTRTQKTIHKISQHLPTTEQFQEWSNLPKTLNTLRKIKFPTLCGWEVSEITDALKPYINKLASKYRTNRLTKEDYLQNGAIGVICAIRTDGGMSPFAHHAYPQIRTCIRRNAATCGLIYRPEKMPSRTEVRREITTWLSGKWLSQEIARVGKLKAVRNYRKLKRDIPINDVCLVSNDDLVHYKVQKIGKSNETENHIKEDFQLYKLGLEILSDLFEYLNHKFGENSLGEFDLVRYKVVGDLVNQIAEPPDFHSSPVSLDVKVDDKFSLNDSLADSKSITPDVLAEKNERSYRRKRMVAKMRPLMNLSEVQDMVLRYSFGLDGCEQISGSEIAQRFGELLGDPPRSVCRQRVMQHQKAIYKKVIEAAYAVSFEDKGRLERIIPDAGLSSSERYLLTNLEGLFGKERRDVGFLVDNLEDITGSVYPPHVDKVSVVKGMIRDIKVKMVGADIF